MGMLPNRLHDYFFGKEMITMPVNSTTSALPCWSARAVADDQTAWLFASISSAIVSIQGRSLD